MTRKTRRKKAKPSGAGAEKTKPSPDSPAESTPEEATAEAAESEKKISLPAFGFAEDLLKQARGSAAESELSAESEPSAESESSADAEPAAESEPSAAAAAAEAVAAVEESPAADRAEAAEPDPAAGESLASLGTRVEETDPRRIFAFADSLDAQAGEVEAAPAPTRLETWVTFSLAGETFALPVEPVREVVRVASITRVPHAPRPIRGVTNMRGRVIPVIDLRLRIELPEADLGRASRVIVVSSRSRLLGLLVDAVHQVVHIDLNQVQPPPDDVMTIQSDYISGVYHLDDQLILLLDIHRVLIIQEVVPGAVTEAAAGASGSLPENTSGEATGSEA